MVCTRLPIAASHQRHVTDDDVTARAHHAAVTMWSRFLSSHSPHTITCNAQSQRRLTIVHSVLSSVLSSVLYRRFALMYVPGAEPTRNCMFSMDGCDRASL